MMWEELATLGDFLTCQDVDPREFLHECEKGDDISVFEEDNNQRSILKQEYQRRTDGSIVLHRVVTTTSTAEEEYNPERAESGISSSSCRPGKRVLILVVRRDRKNNSMGLGFHDKTIDAP